MGFQDIKRIEKAQHYLDTALGKAAARKGKKLKDTHFQNAKTKDLQKINIIRDSLVLRFQDISKNFPSLDNMSEFYDQLLKITLDRDKLKKTLASVDWAQKKIREMAHLYRGRLMKADHLNALTREKKAFIGRISSIVRKISKDLEHLEKARTVITGYPVIKQLFTVCIAGFPNVGKSTLLGKITTSKPEIKSYAFTTKRLNLGYAQMNNKKIQFIDTPGTLARPDKMNNIEKQAYLAIKYQADLIIYIFDLTEMYPLEDQKKLLDNLKKSRKPIIIYLSKTDILDKKVVDDFCQKNSVITDIEELKKEVSKHIS
ncbi:MAG: 50S ribosome-binding GTPase [Nanoarchaeota archaeon]|nr:50S ribosome-binding GTPase [Nanoarchaeota archaeon]MBU1321630.1 50S ribosome-binding GTPase [Nanoarchaeota archaeon]MBU1597414.1 50S ribosome-binding GTPase [Nanoarchaeota archaeon]MBU2440923.1 50S ribosome-binding GTPase [Nanoarchaeota archaeon]